jgi:hypothetical protein
LPPALIRDIVLFGVPQGPREQVATQCVAKGPTTVDDDPPSRSIDAVVEDEETIRWFVVSRNIILISISATAISLVSKFY